MRLKKQRDDVKIIRWQDIVGEEEAKDIARRYLNLIRMAEESFKLNSNTGYIFPDEGTAKEKRVLKDSEGA